MSASDDRTKVITEEVEFIKKNLCDKVEGVEILGCHAKLITFILTKTEYRKLTVSLQFPENYPFVPIHVELKSKVIPHEVLQQVCKICEKQLNNQLGSKQVLSLSRFLKKFLDESPLLPCKDELMKAKNEFLEEGVDELILKQKTGIIVVEAKKSDYYYKFKLEVPDDYPKVSVTVKGETNNFPASLAYYFVCQAREMARQSVQEPLHVKKKKEKFVAKPHVYRIIKFLVHECVKNLPSTICPICEKNSLPPDPKDIVKEEKQALYVLRLLCGHFYHHGCLKKYILTPPFPAGGKKCKVCEQKVAHCKFRISPKIAEARWASKEARQREIDEVKDFFS